jgi:hypothetical protein
VVNNEFDGVSVEWIRGKTPTAFFYDNEGTELHSEEIGNLNMREIEEFFVRNHFPLKRNGEKYEERNTVISSFNGHVYELHPEVNAHSVAFEFLQTRNGEKRKGYIVTINSPEEHHYVNELMNEHSIPVIWLGGSDEEAEGVWKWSGGKEHGETFWDHGYSEFSFWSENEPNDADRDEDCMQHKHNVGWNDVNCYSEKASLLIEYDISPLDVLPSPISSRDSDEL